MKSDSNEEVYEQTVLALAGSGDDALSKAQAEGMPDPGEIAAWTERLKAVVMLKRDPAVLRSEVYRLAEQLLDMLKPLKLPDRGEGTEATAQYTVRSFVVALPAIRAMLAEDVEAAFEGDPAAKGFGEILLAYPSIHAIATYRLAHELVKLGVPKIPRVMSEHAHGKTGIDIHPGAQIGRRIFIDHGTGVVIGETSVIGDNVRIYHGVTLGAFSPRRGQTVRDQKRHPTIGDDVTIYPGATILGGETVVGSGSVVNGNAYVTESVPPGARVVPEPPRQEVRRPAGKSNEAQLHWDI